MNKTLLVGTIVAVVGVFSLGGLLLWQQAGLGPSSPAPSSPAVLARTRAGDALGSGFVAVLIQKPGDIEYATQLASANATGVLGEWGATNGLLKKGNNIGKWGTLKIQKTNL